MPDSIDWKFIAREEGEKVLKGYVPTRKNKKTGAVTVIENSGVTISTGFDLGQHSAGELNALNLSAALTNKLKPYLLKTKQAALDYLNQHPVSVTPAEADEIDMAVKKKEVAKVKHHYASTSYNKNKTQFADLPSQAQTVIASISFQYGSLELKRLDFWKAVCAQDWAQAVKVLRSYKKYRPRRRREADLLEQLVKFDKKVAELLPYAMIWKLVLLLMFLSGASAVCPAQTGTLIFDKALSAAYKDYAASVAEKRTPLSFESGKSVENCADYWREKETSTVKDEVANMLYASEYQICDALKILKEAEKSKKPLPKNKTATNYGREIYNRLDLSSFPSSFSEDASDKHFFKDLPPKKRARFTKYAATSATREWNFTIEIAAVTDYDGDGKEDWILWVADEALKEGNYRDYSTLLVLDAAKKGVLKAQAR